jgi:hypothetical protein
MTVPLRWTGRERGASLSNGKFFIPGIRGLAVWCSFMKRRRGAAQACCAALSRVRRAHAVWKRPNGCSIGQPAVGWCVAIRLA